MRNAAAADEQVSKWKGQNLAVRLAQRSSHLGASVDHFEVTKNQRPGNYAGLLRIAPTTLAPPLVLLPR